MMGEKQFYICEGEDNIRGNFGEVDKALNNTEIVDLLNEQQELIEELQTSDEMGWKRAERFEKKCPKELHNKKMYIKRLEYKVQKFKEMNGEQQDTIRKLRNENIISKNQIEDLRASLFTLTKELERQIQRSGLNE